MFFNGLYQVDKGGQLSGQNVLFVFFGAIAQLGERRTGSAKVCGSIPHSSTIIGPVRLVA